MTAPLRILVIDDEPAIRQILAARLARAGHVVDTAGGGHDALSRLAADDIELALCDVSMPDMNGIDVVRTARAAGVQATFIMMTAFSAVETAVEALQAGASDYLVKPVRNEELQHRVAHVAEVLALRREVARLRALVAARSP
jgi:two-component system response regulator AtoC